MEHCSLLMTSGSVDGRLTMARVARLRKEVRSVNMGLGRVEQGCVAGG